MIEKIKNIFSDNYKVLSLITTLYVIFLYIYNLTSISISKGYSYFHFYYYFKTPFDGYKNDTGMLVLLWLVFIFSIWTIIKLFRTKPKSSLILFFMFLAISSNPLYRTELNNDLCLFIITTISTFVLTVYNWQIIKDFGSITKIFFSKFTKLFRSEN